MNFVLHRDKVVATLTGHAIEFKKGVSTHVPPECYKEVIAVGAVPESEIPEDEGKKPEYTEEERAELIKAAIEDIVLKNDRNEFTAAGAPHIKAISARAGFTVNNRERDAVWTKMQQGDD